MLSQGRHIEIGTTCQSRCLYNSVPDTGQRNALPLRFGRSSGYILQMLALHLATVTVFLSQSGNDILMLALFAALRQGYT